MEVMDTSLDKFYCKVFRELRQSQGIQGDGNAGPGSSNPQQVVINAQTAPIGEEVLGKIAFSVSCVQL